MSVASVSSSKLTWIFFLVLGIEENILSTSAREVRRYSGKHSLTEQNEQRRGHPRVIIVEKNMVSTLSRITVRTGAKGTPFRRIIGSVITESPA